MKINRRGFIKGGLASATALATRMASSPAVQEAQLTAEEWITKIRAMIVAEANTRPMTANLKMFLEEVPNFVRAIIAEGANVGEYIQARGLTYLTMEIDMFLDEPGNYTYGIQETIKIFRAMKDVLGK